MTRCRSTSTSNTGDLSAAHGWYHTAGALADRSGDQRLASCVLGRSASLIFNGVIVATAALACAYFRHRHQQLRADIAQLRADNADLREELAAVELDRIRRDHALKEWLEECFDQLTRENLRRAVQLAEVVQIATETAQSAAHNREAIEDLSRRIPHPVKNMRRGSRSRSGRTGKGKGTEQVKPEQPVSGKAAGQAIGDVAQEFTSYLAAREDLRKEKGDDLPG